MPGTWLKPYEGKGALRGFLVSRLVFTQDRQGPAFPTQVPTRSHDKAPTRSQKAPTSFQLSHGKVPTRSRQGAKRWVCLLDLYSRVCSTSAEILFATSTTHSKLCLLSKPQNLEQGVVLSCFSLLYTLEHRLPSGISAPGTSN